MSAVADMQEYMDRVRGYYERARLLRRFAERVSPARFSGRVARVLAAPSRDGGCYPVNLAQQELAAYHADLLRAERRR